MRVYVTTNVCNQRFHVIPDIQGFHVIPSFVKLCQGIHVTHVHIVADILFQFLNEFPDHKIIMFNL